MTLINFISVLLSFDRQFIVQWYSSFMVHFLFRVTWSDGNKEFVFALFLFDLISTDMETIALFEKDLDWHFDIALREPHF